MLNDKILEFYSELREEVQDYVKTNGPVSVNTAFKTLFLSYLTETGETLVSDCTLVDFKKILRICVWTVMPSVSIFVH